jgi:dethiobiotin synthetase
LRDSTRGTMPKGFFITGTDTGVGKTLIAAAFIKTIQFLGKKVCGMKPVESGCGRRGEALIPNDGMFLRQVSHADEPLTLITPCCLESPLAPMAAAQVDGKDIDIPGIGRAFSSLSGRYEVLVVEGIGGLMVPVVRDYYALDLAGEIGLPLIVVARPGLGTINHIMLTVHCALKAGLTVAGIVINYGQPPENSLAEQTNPKLLSQISPVPVMGTFPYLESREEEEITKAALKNFDLKLIRNWLQDNTQLRPG